MQLFARAMRQMLDTRRSRGPSRGGLRHALLTKDRRFTIDACGVSTSRSKSRGPSLHAACLRTAVKDNLPHFRRPNGERAMTTLLKPSLRFVARYHQVIDPNPKP